VIVTQGLLAFPESPKCLHGKSPITEKTLVDLRDDRDEGENITEPSEVPWQTITTFGVVGLQANRFKRSQMHAVIENHGVKLFECACQFDLEGIVAKRKSSAYRATEQGSPYWIKIKNPHYSQVEGRDELFERQATP